MSRLYVYALLDAPPRGALGAGLLDEPLRLVETGDRVLAAVGELREPPAVEPETLRAHDAVVRRLAAACEAVLPARFGSLVADERALTDLLARDAAALRAALALVRGREQMTLRLFGTPASTEPSTAGTDETAAEESDGLGPGARYLAARGRALARLHAAPEIEPLRPVLARFVRAERVERHPAPPLLASVYHLVDRGAGAAYAEAVQEAAQRLSVQVTVSGPWPAYAFAPVGAG